MASARRASARRNRHVHGFLDQHPGLMLGGEDILARVEGLGQRLAGLSEVLTCQTALGGLEGTMVRFAITSGA